MKNVTDHQSFILKLSTIQGAGVGVFVLHDIAKESHIDVFPNLEEKIYNAQDVPEELQTFCIDQEDGTLLCPTQFNRLDIGHYLNHSIQPNLRHENGKGYFARRDIKTGEELFADYRELSESRETWADYYKKK